MFYSTQILARKGPLGIIWIAAHMDKNLKRSQVRPGPPARTASRSALWPPQGRIGAALVLCVGWGSAQALPGPPGRRTGTDRWAGVRISARARAPRHAPAQVAGAHIPGTVDALLDPEAPLALRLSGQLLLGVVRVYSRQLSFLQQVRGGLQGAAAAHAVHMQHVRAAHSTPRPTHCSLHHALEPCTHTPQLHRRLLRPARP